MRNDDTAPSPWGALFSGWGRDVAIAGMFLTRLPFRAKGDIATSDLADAGRAFPLIGVLVGGFGGGALMGVAELDLHPLACAFIGLAVAALVTGGLHEDGLADVVDGFGGGADKTSKLRIMRDSRIGAYGVLALVFSVGIKASIIAGLPGPGMAAGALLGAAVMSRGILPMMMYIMPMARSDGLAAGAGRPLGSSAVVAFFIGALFVWSILGFKIALLALIAAMISAVVMGMLAHRQIGGYTGDVLGATQQVTEISVLMMAGAFAL